MQLLTFLRFARLHTVIGTSLSIVALYLIAGRITGQADLPLLAWTLLSCLAANVYITGLNQLTDVEIDKINKPYLPLASGAYSIPTGRTIVLVCLLISIVTALWVPPYLTATVGLSLLLGTAYSLPPLRLKRFYFWAAFCILAVRGLIVNLLLYLHFQHALGGGHAVPPVIWLLTGLIFVYSIIIAWYKDLPDTEGDAAHQIDTLSLRLGKQWVWRVGSAILLITLAAVGTYCWLNGRTGLAIGQLLLLLLLLVLGGQLRLDNQRSIARYYQGIWGLFFGEVLLFGVLGG